MATVQLPDRGLNRSRIAPVSQEHEPLGGFRDVHSLEIQSEKDDAEDDTEALIRRSELERERRLLFWRAE